MAGMQEFLRLGPGREAGPGLRKTAGAHEAEIFQKRGAGGVDPDAWIREAGTGGAWVLETAGSGACVWTPGDGAPGGGTQALGSGRGGPGHWVRRAAVADTWRERLFAPRKGPARAARGSETDGRKLRGLRPARLAKAGTHPRVPIGCSACRDLPRARGGTAARNGPSRRNNHGFMQGSGLGLGPAQRRRGLGTTLPRQRKWGCGLGTVRPQRLPGAREVL